MKVKTKTSATLSTKDIIAAIEKVLGKKITDVEWEYGRVMTDAGRGNPTYENAVTGVTVVLKD